MAKVLYLVSTGGTRQLRLAKEIEKDLSDTGPIKVYYGLSDEFNTGKSLFDALSLQTGGGDHFGDINGDRFGRRVGETNR